MATPIQCKLIGLYPNVADVHALPAPAAGCSYVVYQMGGFTEQGIQSSIRVIPTIALALSQTKLSIAMVDKVGQIAAQIVSLISGGPIKLSSIISLLEGLGIKL